MAKLLILLNSRAIWLAFNTGFSGLPSGAAVAALTTYEQSLHFGPSGTATWRRRLRPGDLWRPGADGDRERARARAGR